MIRIYRKIFLVTLAAIFFINGSIWAASSANFSVRVSVDGTPPTSSDDYTDTWRNEDFSITLSATDAQSSFETYYKINNGSQQNVVADGQPFISAEGANNILEYWSIDDFGHEELPHKTVSDIKLDKTPPQLEILAPSDGDAFEAAFITITGTATDALSGIDEVEVSVGSTVYTPTLEPDGSFSITDAPIVDGPNDIAAQALDLAGNQTDYALIVFLGWVLHLDIPYYEIGDYYSGAAASQMILNFIRNGLADDLTQESIYNYGHPKNYSENSSILEMDPKAIDYTLGHFDPYDTRDPYGQGDAYKAYNFTINVFENDKFTEYLRDVIHWIAYPVTIDYWWLDGDLVDWPNTPAAVPAYGTYEHWIVVNGAATSEDPAPNPHDDPYNTPDFTVYGLWLTDPATNGIGQDLYVTAQTVQETYFLPLDTSDRYDGKFLQVSEPPEVTSEAEVNLSEPKVNKDTLKIVEIAADMKKDNCENLSDLEKRIENAKKHIYDAALVVNLKKDKGAADRAADSDEYDMLTSVFNVDQAPIELDWKKVIDATILTDEGFKEAFDGSQVRDFIKVKRDDKDSCYYLIPFDKYTRGSFLTYAAIIINAEDGSFKQASWVKEPTRFIQVTKQKALELVIKELSLSENAEVDVELVWEPGKCSQSPFYPYWKVIAGNMICYVTQDSEVIKNNEPCEML